MKKIIIQLLVLSLCTFISHAEYIDEISFNMGMINTSFTENPSSVDSSSDINESREAASGSVSQIALDATYSFKNESARSYYARAVVPLLPSGGGGNFFGAVGANFYLGSVSSKYSFKVGNIEMVSVPKLRYYWGTQLGLGYLIYTTETAEKSDVYFEIDLHAGMKYAVMKKYHLNLEAGFGRGTGVATTSMNMKVLVGLSYFL